MQEKDDVGKGLATERSRLDNLMSAESLLTRHKALLVTCLTIHSEDSGKSEPHCVRSRPVLSLWIHECHCAFCQSCWSCKYSWYNNGVASNCWRTQPSSPAALVGWCPILMLVLVCKLLTPVTPHCSCSGSVRLRFQFNYIVRF